MLIRALLIFILLCQTCLYARPVDTFYGTFEVEEEVLLELIDSAPFQRLKSIHQYGVAYYTTHREEYNRYDHSLGVFAILRAKGSSLEEQIAGLLHDVSHTAFSHVGDWLYGKENQEEDYQNSIHLLYIEQSELGDILKKHHFAAEKILPKEEFFPALECPLPNLSADRLDYNLQGAYYQGFLTREEAVSIFEDLQYRENRWVSRMPELMKKLTRFSLFMTQNCWGSPANYVASRWLADAILRAVDLGCISHEDIQFGTDQVIWDMLCSSEDPVIRHKMDNLLQSEEHFSLVAPSEADFIVKSRFRGIDPWILSEGSVVRLTALDPLLKEEYSQAKEKVEKGWPLKIFNEAEAAASF